MIVDLGPGRLGLEEDGAVVAQLRAERADGAIAIRELGYRSERDARALVDAFAGLVDVHRLVGSHEVLARCGFAEEDGCWTRELPAEPADDDAHAVLLSDLERAIRAGWGPDTSDVPELWTSENPALGQCAVTALVVRDHLGGEIVAAGVVKDGRRVGRHAWNRLPSGLAVDLTREQFRAGERFERPSVPELLLTARHPERYELLAERVRASLGS